MICTFTGHECENKPYCKRQGACFLAPRFMRNVGGATDNPQGEQPKIVELPRQITCCGKPLNCDMEKCEYIENSTPSIAPACCGSPAHCCDSNCGPVFCKHSQEHLGHTDLMVTPEAIDECLAANPLPIDPMTQSANPKQIHGDKKIPMYLLPFSFAANVCVALYEGMTKYGLVNWRVAHVEAMTYASACKRHIDKWIGGQDHDPATKVRHLANAGACIAILIDAEVNGTLIDNRPLPIKRSAVDKMVAELEETIAHLKVLHKDYDPKHYLITDVTA